MKDTLKVCLVQMTSTDNHCGNIAFLDKAVAYAVHHQCDLLALPEVAGLMNRSSDEARLLIKSESEDPYIKACIKHARDQALWIHTGSTPVAHHDDRFLNHSNLIDSTGSIQARYDKIHLFDISLAGSSPIRESSRYAPGRRASMAQTPWGSWGMSVCYDLRFPHLYRDYGNAGATVMFVPSAFTVKTGAAHWEVLLRARAIENGCFIVAAAQVGQHDDGRQTYGHSLIADPWGRVVTDMGGCEPGFCAVELDMSSVAQTRNEIPSLRHDRDYAFEAV